MLLLLVLVFGKFKYRRFLNTINNKTKIIKINTDVTRIIEKKLNKYWNIEKIRYFFLLTDYINKCFVYLDTIFDTRFSKWKCHILWILLHDNERTNYNNNIRERSSEFIIHIGRLNNWTQNSTVVRKIVNPNNRLSTSHIGTKVYDITYLRYNTFIVHVI